MPYIFKSEWRLLEGIADYILWYGDREELETNLIVVRAKQLADIQGRPLLDV